MEISYGTQIKRNDTHNKARKLISVLLELEKDANISECILYYDFPIFRDNEDILCRTNVLLISQFHGVIIFESPSMSNRNCSERGLFVIEQNINHLYRLIKSKLLRSKLLSGKRDSLKLIVGSAIYLPDCDKLSNCDFDDFDSEILFNRSQLLSYIKDFESHSSQLSSDEWRELKSIIEGAKGFIRPKERIISENDTSSKAYVLSKLEEEIHTFDSDQKRAAISLINGPQRIRGLAGSGKTIILAMKAAHIHLTNPEAMILYTFHTKSLYDFVKRLITRFYRQFTDFDPDWERVNILHGWGGKYNKGVYYNACIENSFVPLTFGKASSLDIACRNLLEKTTIQQKYDYIIIDEAQDFSMQFYWLCFRLAKGGIFDRNIIWAYDELQSIMSARKKINTDIFGIYTDGGEHLMDFERSRNKYYDLSNDIVLRKCYRNPREILVVAHALGLGVYSDHPVQMLENKEHWEDVGYNVTKGDCIDGEFTEIYRPEENSPLSIATLQTTNDIIKTFVADDFDSEIQWVCNEVISYIEDGLFPNDILVICLNDSRAKEYYLKLSELLSEKRIMVNNILDNPYGIPDFNVDNHITLSRVHHAKGNEAACVFVMGIDSIESQMLTREGRNKLFTSFTRAKAWLRVSGIGLSADIFVKEINTAIEHIPYMKFTYPNKVDIETLHRDYTEKKSKMYQLEEELYRKAEEMGLSEEEIIQFLLEKDNRRLKDKTKHRNK